MEAKQRKIASCHPNRFAQARGLCKNCYDKWLKSVNPEYKKAQRANADSWELQNLERVKASKRKYARKPRSKELVRNWTLKRNYGITSEDYNKMLSEQQNSCKLCFRKQGQFRLHVDHCHVTGKVRGILCHQCNWYLGVIEADPLILGRITSYLAIKGGTR